MNDHRFDEKGGIYAAFRPSYPFALFDYLKEKGLGGNECTVADIGAGTGIFTRQLAAQVRRVYAVEPNDSMREAGIREQEPSVTWVKGSAEDTALPSSSVDGVTAAQAFHWFDREKFGRECRRILKPGGSVALIWNDRDMEHGLLQELLELNRRFCPGFRGFSEGRKTEDRSVFDEFFTGGYERQAFANEMMYDREAWIGRCLSSSYAPKEGEAYREAYVEALQELFDRRSRDGKLKHPYVTRCYWGHL